MSELTATITRLSERVHQLVDKHQQAQQENNRLREEMQHLKQRLAAKDSEIADLNEKHKLVKLAKSLGGDESNNTELKLKINELVREVDKCIALLNR